MPATPFPRSPGGHHWQDRTAQAALFLLCLSAFSAPAVAEAATILLVLAFLLAAPRWKQLVGEPVLLIALLAAAYATAHTLGWAILRPDQAGLYLDGLGDWLRLLLFVPFAVYSRGDEHKLDILLLLTLLGLLAGIAIRLDWAALWQNTEAFFAARPGFGMPALPFALYSGACIVGLLTVGRRQLHPPPRRPGHGLLEIGGWTLATTVLVAALGLTSARSGWLAILAAAPVGLWCAARRCEVSRRQATSWPWLKTAAGLLALIVVLTASQRAIVRVLDEGDTLMAILAGEEPALRTSDALRWDGLRFGIETWQGRPLLGWGAEVSGHLIKSSDRNDLRTPKGVWLEHLHNGYLEILVQFGLLGLVLTTAFFLAFLLRMRILCRVGRISARYCGFFAGALVLVLVWSLFDYRVPHRDWRVFWMILAGSAYGFLLRHRTGLDGDMLKLARGRRAGRVGSND